MNGAPWTDMDENREQASWIGGRRGIIKSLVSNILILMFLWYTPA